MRLDLGKENIEIENNIIKTPKVQKEIFQIMEKAHDTNYDDLMSENTSNFIFSQLSNIRKNIIDWYPFSSDARVLEIGTDYGIVTECLCQKVNQVVSTCFSTQMAQIVAKKLKDIKNLEIKVGKLPEIDFVEKFDYIVAVSELDCFSSYFNGDCVSYLKYLKTLLKPNGTILLASDNRLGIKYMAGSVQEHKGGEFYLFDEERGGNSHLYSKREWDENLFNAGITNYRFYYPLPDYKMIDVIFSDEYLPNKYTSKLIYNLYNLEGSNLIFNELNAMKAIVESGNFQQLTNSFLIEISTNVKSEDAENIRFVSFNNIRKEKYRLITKMYHSYVEKVPQFSSSQSHVEQIKRNIDELSNLQIGVLDSYENDKILSHYCALETMSRNLVDKIKSKEIISAYSFMELWKNYIEQKFCVQTDNEEIKKHNIFQTLGVEVDDSILDKFSITKYGYIDFVFENLFYKDNKFITYDQEWYYENTPIEYIMYRAICNLYSYSIELEERIPKKELIEKFELTSYIAIFEKLEQAFQLKILDNKRKLLYQRCYTRFINLSTIIDKDIKEKEYVNVLLDDIAKYKEIQDELQQAIIEYKQNSLQDQVMMNDLRLKLSDIYQSKGWKMLEKIRKLKPSKINSKEKKNGEDKKST